MDQNQNHPAGPVTVRAMSPNDHEALVRLWQDLDGIGMCESDTPAALQVFLERNPGFSAVAVDPGARVIGSVLCGHDGRRGYLYHVAVAPVFQRQGVAKALLDYALDRLARAGILKCNACVYAANQAGKEFWRYTGWVERTDLVLVQKTLTPCPTRAG